MKKTALFLMLTGLLIVTGLPVATLAAGPENVVGNGMPFNMPSANMSLNNIVPFDIVTKVALFTAKDKWGQVSQGTAIPCSDENGDIVAYMFPFHVGPGPFPGYQQIMQGVREGRSMTENLQKGFNAAQSSVKESPVLSSTRQVDGTPTMTGPAGGYPSDLSGGTAQPDGQQLETANYQAAVKAAKMKGIGAGEYGTVYVSARYDRVPVPLISHYLPTIYTTGDLAFQKASGILNGNIPKLARYYFLGWRGQFYEFDSGGGRVFIHAYSLEEAKPVTPVGPSAASPEQLIETQQEWTKIINSVEGGGVQ